METSSNRASPLVYRSSSQCDMLINSFHQEEENNVIDKELLKLSNNINISNSSSNSSNNNSNKSNPARPCSQPNTSIINEAPQNYVVVNGKTFRVTRSPKFNNPSNNPLSISSPHSLQDLTKDGRFTPVLLEDVESLRQALENAESLIHRQNETLLKQAKKIEKMENALKNNNITISTNNSISNLSAVISDIDLENMPRLSPRSSPRGLCERRRSESRIIHIMASENPETSPAGSDSSASQTSVNQGSDLSSYLQENNDYITPKNAESSLKPQPFSAPPSNILRRNSDELNTTVVSLSDSVTKSPQKGPPRGLAARLAMGSTERRKVAAAKRLKSLPPNNVGEQFDTDLDIASDIASSNVSPIETGKYSDKSEGLEVRSILIDNKSPIVSPRDDVIKRSLSGSPTIIFKWKKTLLSSSGKEKDLKDLKSRPYLFIAHDNPQLGNTVAAQLGNDTEGMHIMLETKDDKGLSYFILGTIVYSGDLSTIEGADNPNPRGSQFIVCTDMRGIKADIKSFPTRVNGDINEIGLDRVEIENYFDLSSVASLKEFFKSITSRVDVILDPSHTDMWYPYFEGRRKMAPQFRSKGIGYIRLGDDMSRYGSAFLSLDAGMTFLDDGATIITASDMPNVTDSFYGTFPGAAPRSSLTLQSLSGKSNNGRPESGSKRPSSTSRVKRPSSGLIVDHVEQNDIDKRNPRDIEKLREIIARLKDDMKWSERTELLKTLQENPACGDSSHVSEVIGIVIENLTKQKNPHVLRAAVRCIRDIGSSSMVLMTAAVAWRTLLLESIHLLRVAAKPIYEEARDSLSALHGRSISVSYLSGMFDDIFAGPRGKGSGGASNTARVIQWLESIGLTEIKYNAQRILSGNADLFYEKIDTATSLQRCKSLLFHREEVTREAAVGMCALLLVYDILQYSEQAQDQTMSLQSIYKKLYKFVSDIPGATTKKDLKYTNPSSSALITRYISSSCAAILIEVDKIATRIHEKIMAATLQLFVSIISSINSTNSKAILNTVATISSTITEKMDDSNTKRNARISHSPITTPLS